jgi:hypothetical protein
LGIVIPVARLLQDPSVVQLADATLEQLSNSTCADSDVMTDHANEEPLAVQTEAVVANHETSATELLANLDNLSEAEIDEMLKKMMP